MSKPKLAILMSGHMRSFRLTSPSFLLLRESLKEKYECKTFIHTWNISESHTRSYYNKPTDLNVEKVDYDLLNTLYSPDSALIEKQDFADEAFVLSNQSLAGLCCSEYSKYKSNQLKKEYGEFDLAISLRPDVHFYSTELPEFSSEYVSLGSVRHNGAACDLISFCSSKLMDRVRDFHLCYEQYLKTYSLPNNEAYFIKYLNNSGIKFKLEDYYMPRDWKIVRSWWPSVDHFDGDRQTWDNKYER